MKPIFHALKLFNFKRRNTGDWEYTAQINHHLYQHICADAYPDAYYFSSEFLLPPSYLIDSCHKNLRVVISFGKQHQVYGSLNRLHWLATWKPPIDNRYHWSDGIKVYPRTRSSLLVLKGAHTHPTVITSYLADGLRVKFWYSFIFGVVFLIYQNTELLTTEETVLLQHQRLSNTKMANIRRIWMEELSWKTVGGPFSKSLFIHRSNKTKIFCGCWQNSSLAILLSACCSEYQAFSCTWKWAWKTFGKSLKCFWNLLSIIQGRWSYFQSHR